MRREVYPATCGNLADGQTLFARLEAPYLRSNLLGPLVFSILRQRWTVPISCSMPYLKLLSPRVSQLWLLYLLQKSRI